MEEENKQKRLWWFMWSTKDIGRSISSELNNKRNTFVFNVKNSFECVLSAKPDREHFKKVIVTTLEWISDPDFFQISSFS